MHATRLRSMFSTQSTQSVRTRRASYLLAAWASLSAAALLSACGGGSSAAAAGAAAAGAGGGTVTGNIAAIVGSYSVKVSAQDCAASTTATTKVEPQTDGSCKITTSLPGLATSVEVRRDMLKPGNYTLEVAADGSVKIGTITIACPSGGICRVDGPANNTVYSVAGGTASAGGASIGISQISFNTTASPKTVVGVMYGNATNVTGVTIATGESGVVAIGS
jgi:hypothetical protein